MSSDLGRRGGSWEGGCREDCLLERKIERSRRRRDCGLPDAARVGAPVVSRTLCFTVEIYPAKLPTCWSLLTAVSLPSSIQTVLSLSCPRWPHTRCTQMSFPEPESSLVLVSSLCVRRGQLSWRLLGSSNYAYSLANMQEPSPAAAA